MGAHAQALISYGAAASSGPASIKRSITIDRTKCGASGSRTDFPFAFFGTSAFLKTVANGGEVQSASGYDVFFTSDAAGANLLSWEQVIWNGTTGEYHYVIKIPSLTTASDTVIYVWTGNASTSSFQGGSTGAAYNSNFKLFQHMKDGSTLNTNDSTSNGNNGTNSGGTAVAGQVDGGVGFTAGSKVTMTKNLASIIGSSNAHSISFLVYFTTQGATNYCVDLDTANALGMFCNIKSGNSVEWGYAGTYRTYTSVTTTTGTWYYVTLEKTGSGDAGNLYLNGVLQSSYSGTLGNPNTAASTGSQWGAYHSSTVLCLDGKMDELSISDTARGADWALAMTNNLLNSGSFYTVSSPL